METATRIPAPAPEFRAPTSTDRRPPARPAPTRRTTGTPSRHVSRRAADSNRPTRADGPDTVFSYMLPGFRPLTAVEQYRRLDAMVERRDEIRLRRRARLRRVARWIHVSRPAPPTTVTPD